MISTFCFITTGALLLEAIIRKSDFFSPFRLYVFFHSFTLGIAFLDFHDAMTPFGFTTNVVYYMSGICFCCGTLVVLLLIKHPLPDPVRFRPVDAQGYRWHLHFFLTLPIFLTYLTGMMLAAKGIGTLPLFSAKIVKTVYEFMTYSTVSSLFIATIGLTLALSFILAVMKKHTIAGINVAKYMCIGAILLHITTLSRSSLIFFMFFALVFYHYAVKRVSISRLTVMAVMLLLVFSTIAYLKVYSFTKEQQIMKISTGKVLHAMLTIPYTYIANNFWNLDYGINTENYRAGHKRTYGFTTVSGIYDLIYTGYFLGNEFRESMNYESILHKQTQKVEGLNTVSYQWGLYKDFGALGTFILPFLFGVAVSILYWKVRAAPTVFNIGIYAFLAYFIAFSWFLAFWEINVYIYPLAYLALCCLACSSFPAAVRSDAPLPLTLQKGGAL